MSDCPYCGQPAGFFRKSHADCDEKYKAGWAQMVERVRLAIRQSSLGNLLQELEGIANEHRVPNDNIRAALVAGWGCAVDDALEDGLLTTEEETSLVQTQREFNLSQDELERSGSFMKVAKAAVLRDLMVGKVSARLDVSGAALPFNFQKSESLLWLFQGVDYMEARKATRYVGTSHGVSVRIAKGLYYRTSAFRGHPIQETSVVNVGRGTLAVTTKQLYFACPGKSFRIPFTKIVTIEPFTDGVSVQRDAASALPQLFRTGDGWFTYNLLTNVGSI